MATERLDRVEDELALVRERLRRLEAGEEAGAAAQPLPPAATPKRRPTTASLWEPTSLAAGAGPAPRTPDTAPRPAPRSALDWEEVFGGRVLAWIGGLAILFAAVLFVGMAISRGWIDEEARTIIAAVFSVGLLAGGVWLRERHGQTEAAEAAVAAAISGLFGTILVAVQAYDLVAPGLGLALAAIVAALGFAVAIRWDAPVIAAVGGLGALGAPILVGAPIESTSPAFLAIALAASVGVLVWRRWDWLALGAFVVSAPQLFIWLIEGHLIEGGTIERPVAVSLLVLVGFWLLYVLAAVGYELRTRDRGESTLPISSWAILLGGCAFVVGLGHSLLEDAGAHAAAVVWLFGFAAIHLALGEAAIRLRIHRETGAVLIGLGIVVSAFGFGEALDGPALVAAWAAEAVALAALSRRLDVTQEAGLSGPQRLLLAAAGFLGLAVLHTLSVEAPLTALFEGVGNLPDALAAIAACAAAALAICLTLRRERSPLAVQAGLAGGIALVYLGSVAIVDTVGVDAAGEVVQSGQVWLSAFWTVTGLATVIWGLVRPNGTVRLGGLALLGVAIAKVWTYDLSELEELARVLSFVGLGLLLLVGSFAYQRIKPPADGAAR